MEIYKWEITPSFVAEKLIHEPVTEVSVKAGSNVGDNVAGSLEAITAKTKSGKIINLVFKTFPNDPEMLAYITEAKIFRIETAVYETLVPSLTELLVKAGQKPTLPLPKCYAAYNDDMKDFLCLEDLRVQDYKMLDKFIGLNNAETTAVLQELARFHALTYHLIRYEGEKYFKSGNKEIEMLIKGNWIQDTDPIKSEQDAKFFGGSIKLGIETIEAKDAKLADKVRRTIGDYANAAKILKSTGLKTDRQYFPVIIHGDLWTNNIMFRTNKDDGSVDVKFVDFQQSRRGNIYEDLQYFILSSTTPADRRIYLHNWLNVYYTAFVKTLEGVACPKPSRFTFGSFVDGMWECFLSGYVYMHFAIPFHLGIHTPLDGEIEEEPPKYSGGEGPPDFDKIFEMQNKKFRKWMERSPAAKQRLLEITQEFAEYGLI